MITLSPTADNLVSAYNNLIVLSGTNAGIEYWFDGTNWNHGQQKTSINQTPMFDAIDVNGISLGDTAVYPDSSFATTENNLGTTIGGTPIFTYQVGNGQSDQILGFPLTYRTFNQVGDIQFVNNFDSDQFSYIENGASITGNINTLGTLQQNTGLTTYNVRNAWSTVVEPSHQYQTISGIYDGSNPYFQIDILPPVSSSVPYIKVYKNFKELVFVKDYIIVQQGVNYYVYITISTLTENDQIDILIYSKNTVSALGYYEVPKNLDNNSQNNDFSVLTLGQLRNHVATLVENSNQVTGNFPGNSNIRDLYIKAQGGSILQHASPVWLSSIFLIDENANFLKSLDLARREYSKLKNKIIELSMRTSGLDFTNIPALLDTLLKTINSAKNKSFSWYYSDMVPYGDIKNTISYTVENAQIVDYEISNEIGRAHV